MTKIYLPELIDIGKLRLLPTNSQKQSKEVFQRLKINIQENGFDESLIVKPVEDEPEVYEIISGNHRYKAAKELGFTQLPCVVRDDWDQIKSELQSVRRNVSDSRGSLDSFLFTAQVRELQDRHEIDLTEIIEGMGFADEDSFSKIYQSIKKEEEEILSLIEEEEEQHEEESADVGIVKMVENLDLIISQILNEHGHTIKNGFLILPVGGKTHLYISANRKLKSTIQSIAKAAFTKGLDINVALAGLLSIGLSQTDFLSRNEGEEVLNQGGESDDEGIEFEEIK